MLIYSSSVILIIILVTITASTNNVAQAGILNAAGRKSSTGDLSNPDEQNIQLDENDRLEEYYKRNYTWPLNNYNPNTPGWKALMERRFQQVSQLESDHHRYVGYQQTLSPAFLVPNFTEHGFGLARCPDDLLEALQQGIHDGLAVGPPEEVHADVIAGPNRPLLITKPALTNRVLHELRYYAETWANNITLKPYRAYGFRIYRNESQLFMHVDKMQTHIISFILHIDSSNDAEPWPIFIEDFHGRTHEVILTPGDMLFYESSKCLHGRPKKFNGSWYSSVFVHYYPEHGWYDQNHELEAHYAVPPHWHQRQQHQPTSQDSVLPRLELVGASMKEPDCPNDWCASQDSIKWSGPGEEGKWIAPTFERYPFEPKQVIWNEEL